MTGTNTQSRRDHKKNEMRLHIVQIAMSLFRKQGFDKTTMEGIAEAADVAKRTLYSYFPVKEAIVSSHWLLGVRKKCDLLPLLLQHYPDTRSRLMAVFLDGVKGLKADAECARIHFAYQFQQIGKSTQANFQSDFDLFLTAIMQAGQQQGDIRDDLPEAELAFQIMLNFTATCLVWFSDPESFSLDERLTHVVDCFIDGAARR